MHCRWALATSGRHVFAGQPAQSIGPSQPCSGNASQIANALQNAKQRSAGLIASPIIEPAPASVAAFLPSSSSPEHAEHASRESAARTSRGYWVMTPLVVIVQTL